MRIIKYLFISLCFFFPGTSQAQETYYKPFTLAQQTNAEFATLVQDIKSKLTRAGYTIEGEYTFLSQRKILIISNAKLKNHASLSPYGGYGAAIRVAITKAESNIQVSFNNPVYMAHAYRMKEDLSDIAQQLQSLLGFIQDFGSEKGLTKNELRDYQYKIFMPDFEDRLELAEYVNYTVAVKKVEASIRKGNGGTKLIYRIDLPDKNETVFGIAISGTVDQTECAGDKFIMDKIDFREIKSSAHLPYEILVKGQQVFALFAEFRIAISFPDLSMVGDNSFFSIMCAPSSIEHALTLAAGGSVDG